MPFDSIDSYCHLIITILFLTHGHTCLLLITLSERLTLFPLTKYNSNCAQILIHFSLSRLCSRCSSQVCDGVVEDDNSLTPGTVSRATNSLSSPGSFSEHGMMSVSPESRPICLLPHHLDESPHSISHKNSNQPLKLPNKRKSNSPLLFDVFNYDLGMMKEKGSSWRPCKSTKTIPLSANMI
ncbi:uncharacterized protein LOC108197127 isoform X2 [Daucus carota subsp. sativus]|uniref:uncharacterized protein LOC108197127 isoform X2 n=1 Tax=Daucus carota subsp. sativus TaxID=79200 RepID=UPI003083C764